jgi:hypothetical protein
VTGGPQFLRQRLPDPSACKRAVHQNESRHVTSLARGAESSP